jgi:hypothetical protein
MKEESNNSIPDNIKEVIKAIKSMAEDILQELENIEGEISIYLTKKNPYISIFRVMKKPVYQPDFMAIGFLLQRNLGSHCPLISIYNTGNQRSLFQKASENLPNLDDGPEGPHRLFHWQGRSVIINANYPNLSNSSNYRTKV